jgi:hypothetical protein
MTDERRASEAAIRALIERRATAVQSRDLDGVLADHSDDSIPREGRIVHRLAEPADQGTGMDPPGCGVESAGVEFASPWEARLLMADQAGPR